MKMRLNKGVVRYLLSTPAGFVGESEVKGRFLLSHCFPISNLAEQFSHAALSPPPFTRTHLVLSFKHQDPSENISNELVFERMTSSFAVFFGKRVDDLGLLEQNGIHALPLFSERPISKYVRSYFWNSLPRVDCGYGFRQNRELLNLSDFSPFAKKALKANSKKWKIFFNAASFYKSALSICSLDIEKAYTDLVISHEIISSFTNFKAIELYSHDKHLFDVFSRLKKAGLSADIPFIKKRLFQLKRKIVLTSSQLLSSQFFSRTESQGNTHYPPYHFGLKREVGVKYVQTSYDLRSKYLHDGASIQSHIVGLTQFNSEIDIGLSSGEDSVTRKNYATFVGLERMTRYMLLRFIATEAGLTHPHLSESSLGMPS